MTAAKKTVRRAHDRTVDELRPVRIEVGPMKFAEGSALIEMGDTRVLVAASVEHRVPPFLINTGRGWATAEYAMLPRATPTRSTREVTRGRLAGRSAEIQRLIGRSVRAVLDLEALPELTLAIDCDVLQADGGTRTAAITGAYVAAVEALAQLFLTGDVERWPLTDRLAAVSVGLVDGVPLLDLDAPEDRAAEVDLNVVAGGGGELVEVQGTGERRSFRREELDCLLDLALAGIRELQEHQSRALAQILEEVEAVRAKGGGRRRPAKPKNERELWGKP
ncbi:MAG: ribonuclease PH [Thermoanaerobaculia bacterium]